MRSRTRPVVTIAIITVAALATVPGVHQHVIAASTVVRLSPQDTTINIDATNYSSDPLLTTYTWPDNRIANAILMKFDMSALPAGAIVENAILHMGLVGADATPDLTYTMMVHKVMSGNPDLATATGYTSDGVTAWTPNACCYNNVPMVQGDISLAYDLQLVDKINGDKSWNITAMVNEWQADPASNFGLLLNSDPSTLADRYRYFASMEHPDATLRPFVEITYSLPLGDITPPSVVLTTPLSGTDVSGSGSVGWLNADILNGHIGSPPGSFGRVPGR